MSRAHIAAASLLAGVVAGPAGALVQWGIGAALLVASGLLLLAGILLGWDS